MTLEELLRVIDVDELVTVIKSDGIGGAREIASARDEWGAKEVLEEFYCDRYKVDEVYTTGHKFAENCIEIVVSDIKED